MKQKIEQLSRGIFEYQLPEILLSEERLQIAAVAGETYRGSFIVKNSKGSRMKGVLYSSSRLFVLSEDKFVGEEISVHFSFRAEYMEPGETLEGDISIITECGEAVLPFEVRVEPPTCGSSIGEIRDIALDLTGLQGGLQGIVVYKKIPGEVQDHNAILHHSDGLSIDHVLGAVQQGYMEGDNIAVGIDLFPGLGMDDIAV